MQTNLAPEYQNTADGQEAEAILRKCVHCGFCTATCPTYQLLGDELDGPRGRIYLIKQVLEGVAPWGGRAVRAHANMADNLAIYAAVISLAYATGAANATTALAGTVLLTARFLHAAVYIAGIPYLRTAVFAVAQLSMLVYAWQIVAHFMAQ
jgi:uncharacterized MAPEG superfamily protein